MLTPKPTAVVESTTIHGHVRLTATAGGSREWPDERTNGAKEKAQSVVSGKWLSPSPRSALLPLIKPTNAPARIAAAERVPSNVELIVGDAGSHVYEDSAFDAIIANFGIMFFQDNEAAFRNLRKAVKQGGRMAATVWATPQENPWFSMPRRIVDEKILNVPRPDPVPPPSECEAYADTLPAERVRRVISGYEFQGTQKEELLL